MEWHFTFEQGIFDSQIHLPLFLDKLLIHMYSRWVRHQHLVIYAVFDMFWEAVKIISYGLSLLKKR